MIRWDTAITGSNMEKGLYHLHVRQTVECRIDRLPTILNNLEIPVFSTVDHKANAVSIGLGMKVAWVVSFGNPATGTPLMRQSPETAVELPLKISARKSIAGMFLSWSDSTWIAERFDADPDSETIAKMCKIFETIIRKMLETY